MGQLVPAPRACRPEQWTEIKDADYLVGSGQAAVQTSQMSPSTWPVPNT